MFRGSGSPLNTIYRPFTSLPRRCFRGARISSLMKYEFPLKTPAWETTHLHATKKLFLKAQSVICVYPLCPQTRSYTSLSTSTQSITTKAYNPSLVITDSFALVSGESPYIFSDFNPLNKDTFFDSPVSEDCCLPLDVGGDWGGVTESEQFLVTKRFESETILFMIRIIVIHLFLENQKGHWLSF